MNRKEPAKDEIKDFAIKGFLALLSLIMSVFGWFVIDMHSDVKMLMIALPELKIKIQYLEVGRAEDQMRVFNLIPRIGKHEDEITLDTLNKK